MTFQTYILFPEINEFFNYGNYSFFVPAVFFFYVIFQSLIECQWSMTTTDRGKFTEPFFQNFNFLDMIKENSGKSNSRGKTISRRSFLRTTTAASAAFTIIPSVAMGKKLGYMAPSDTLNVALIGAGSQGSGEI